MGNCLKAAADEDNDSLLLPGDEPVSNNQTDSRLPYGIPPPPYSDPIIRRRDMQVADFLPAESSHRIPSHNQQQRQNSDEIDDADQIRVIKRLGIIQQLTTGYYDGSKKTILECAICMEDFCVGDKLRYLPCCHMFHETCIDEWLLREFKCPSCMEPVDAVLLRAFGPSIFNEDEEPEFNEESTSPVIPGACPIRQPDTVEIPSETDHETIGSPQNPEHVIESGPSGR